MKAVKSKAQERREIEHQIRFYLQKGGEVKQVENGVSGRPIGANFGAASVSFNQPRETRTLLLDQVKAIDSRKSKPSPSVRTSPKTPAKPKKVLIKDDFGEPIRWSWKD